MGAAFNKGLTFKMGQTHMQHYLRPLLERVQKKEIDLSFIITHRGHLEDAPGHLQDVPRPCRPLHQVRHEAELTAERSARDGAPDVHPGLLYFRCGNLSGMSRLVARILLSMFLFPFGGLLYAVTEAVGEYVARGGTRDFHQRVVIGLLAADIVTWGGVAVYWCALWRSTVRWSPGRVRGTIGVAVAAAALGHGISVILGTAGDGDGQGTEFILTIGGLLTVLLWLFATVLIWCDTPTARAARVGGSAVTCPTCGYNLTGLGEARCPECGSRFTLDELLAAQPARVVAAELA